MRIIVRQPCYLVNRKGTVAAAADSSDMCNHPRMKAKHPVRPHLRAWREHHKFSQIALAQRLRVSHTSVLRWETGESGVSDAVFAQIAKVYGISVAELSLPPEQADKARQLHRLLTILPDLDQWSLTSLADLAERLARPPE
jgi:transcriptional regulator with XRE-family HTH domain